jgi:hypothetical protein
LANWALYGMLVKGLSNLRVEKLKHKSEAIRVINSKIATCNGTITDELVGTVLTLASFEVGLPPRLFLVKKVHVLIVTELDRSIRRSSATYHGAKTHGKRTRRTLRIRT